MFYHRTKDVTVVVHGDDFAAAGDPKHLESTKGALSEKYKIETEVLGSAASDMKGVRILNRVVRITDQGIELEADSRHSELVIRELGLEGCRPSRVHGSKIVADQVGSRVIKPSASRHQPEGELASIEENEDKDMRGCEGKDGTWRRRHNNDRLT